MGYAEDAMRELQDAMRELHEGPTSGGIAVHVRPVLYEVHAELAKARATHAPMNGHHEGYAVILEELDELWEVCKRNTHKTGMFGGEARNIDQIRASKRSDMRKEAIQVAAMAVRFVEDVCDK